MSDTPSTPSATSASPAAPAGVSLYDARPFFEKALQYGMQHGLINQAKLDDICRSAPKGMVQIAAYFGSEFLRPELERARELLQQHGNYDWLTSSGKLVVLSNGIEFAVTYLVMLVALFFSGAGRWLSLYYWLDRALRQQP